MSDDPFELDNIRLQDVTVEGVRQRKSKPSSNNGERNPPVRGKRKKLFVQFDYEVLMDLSGRKRYPALAVLTELYRLTFEKWDKTQPVALGNGFMKELGFCADGKIRALKALEEMGVVTVEWRRRKSPLVRLLAFNIRAGVNGHSF